jgi:hypothetical protein
MSDKVTLVVRFRMNESVKKEYTEKLQEVFTHIMKEETFVAASLVQNLRDPESILNYEVWNESPESFVKNSRVVFHHHRMDESLNYPVAVSLNYPQGKQVLRLTTRDLKLPLPLQG